MGWFRRFKNSIRRIVARIIRSDRFVSVAYTADGGTMRWQGCPRGPHYERYEQFCQ